MAGKGEVKAINKKIKAIFKKHKIRQGRGEEQFWEAVERVKKESKSDAKKLEKLADHWAVAMSFNLGR